MTPIFIDFGTILGAVWGTISDFFSRFFRLLDALGPILGSRRHCGNDFYRFFVDFGGLFDLPGQLFGSPGALVGYILGVPGHSCRMCEKNP